MGVHLIFKDATKIQNGRQKSTPKYFVGAKTLYSLEVVDRVRLQKLSRKLFKFYNHIPHDMDMCICDFFKALRKFKMAAMRELQIVFLAQKRKKIKSETMCRWFYWNLKRPPQVDLLNICDRNNLIYGGGWYRTSVLLFMLFIYSPYDEDCLSAFRFRSCRCAFWGLWTFTYLNGRLSPISNSNMPDFWQTVPDSRLSTMINFNMPDIW